MLDKLSPTTNKDICEKTSTNIVPLVALGCAVALAILVTLKSHFVNDGSSRSCCLDFT